MASDAFALAVGMDADECEVVVAVGGVVPGEDLVDELEPMKPGAAGVRQLMVVVGGVVGLAVPGEPHRDTVPKVSQVHSAVVERVFDMDAEVAPNIRLGGS